MNETDTRALLAPVMAIVREAGELTLTYYQDRRPLDVTQKADDTPVTAADRAAHELILRRLRQLTPDLPVLSEESAPADIAQRRRWPRFWLVDPLDGTKEFLKGNGEFTINIALVEGDRTVLGAVHRPVGDTTYGGCIGQGALKQLGTDAPAPIRTRALDPNAAAAMLVSRSHLGERTQTLLAQLHTRRPLAVTPMGSSLKLCLIAEGSADLHLRIGPTSEWDTGAAQAVLEAAGGRVTDLSGVPLRYNARDTLINPDFIAQGDPEADWLELLKD